MKWINNFDLFLFDFDGLYTATTDWAKNYGYMWHEKTYKHKVPSPKGAEQEMAWDMTKNVTEYISHLIMLTVHIWDMTEVKVDVNGKTKTLTNARIYIKIVGTLNYDWQGQFKGSKFAEKLGRLYLKLMSKDVEGIYWDTFYYRLWNLHAILKKYFDMQTKKHVYKGYLGDN